ncbi:ATP-binding response regulator [Solemya pervernicosa gill symbiont]|nr:ATP-binding protein [Solemya pervernicosa gill symbiont]
MTTDRVASEQSADDQARMEGMFVKEAVDEVFRAIKAGPFAVILIPAIVVAVMWSQIDTGILLLWLSLMVCVILIRYRLAGIYHSSDVTWENAQLWSDRFTLTSLGSGLLWASTPIIFFVENSISHQLFILTLVISLSIGSVLFGAYMPKGFYYFSIPTLSAVVGRLLLEGSVAYVSLSMLMLWYLLMSIALNKKMCGTIRSEMLLRYNSDAMTEALQVKTEEANQAALAKSRFLAAASHDLRQPLHSMTLLFDVLKEAESREERQRLLSKVDLSLVALRNLFDALLDVSRLDANEITAEMSHFDIDKLMKQLSEEFETEAKDKGLRLSFRNSCGAVVTDRLLLERIVRNLISNALFYTEKGGVLLTCRKRGEKILLQVWDSGIGIPEQDQEVIFDEFHQLNNARRNRSEGLGLGLAIVNRLCQLLDLPISVRSRVGRGSVFSIELPAGSESMVVAAEQGVQHSWDLAGRILLVVDDDCDVLDAMEELLTKWGCRVIVADTLEKAIAAVDRSGSLPDAFISDLRLSEVVTGVEALDVLRERYGRSIPGILITGDSIPDQAEFTESTGYQLLLKPVQPARLRTVIHQSLSE